jgi:hypothetical protein
MIAVDLGQMQDSTAIIVCHEGHGHLHITYIERMLGVTYDLQMKRIAQLYEMHGGPLVCDISGVGRGVVDMGRAMRLPIIGISITGGMTASFEGGTHRVPKVELINALVLLTQQKRIHVLPDVSPTEATALREEMLAFSMRVFGNHTSMEASTGNHDDLVLACSLAAWYSARPQQVIRIAGFKRDW